MIDADPFCIDGTGQVGDDRRPYRISRACRCRRLARGTLNKGAVESHVGAISVSLEAAGMSPQQAQGTAAALAETMIGDLVTREHFDQTHAADREYLEAALRADREYLEVARRADREYLEQARRADREYLDLRLAELGARIKADVRGWLITQAFAIVGAVAAIVGVAAALTRLIH